MSSPFELKIDLSNDCRLLYAFFAEFEILGHMYSSI